MIAPLFLALAALAADVKPSPPPSTDTKHDDAKHTESTGSAAPLAPNFQSAGSASTPQGRVFGLGLQLGYPTAVTIKYMLKPDQGIVAGLGGFSGFAYNAAALSLHADYVWHPHQFTATEVFALTWYFGGGANVIIWGPYNGRQNPFIPGVEYYRYPTNIWLAGRMPFGLDVAFQQVPFEVYFELVPMLLVFPAVTFGMGADIGFRFYF